MSNAENLAFLAQALIADAAGNITADITPPQFDNDKSVATTEFVQRALGNLAGIQVFSVSSTIPASAVGKWVAPNANNVTLTLPDAAAVPAGSVLHFYGNQTTGAVIARNGTTNIVAGSSSVASMALGTYDRLSLMSTGAAWYALDGEAAMGYSSSFASSIVTNGYQKLPSGLIIQWGGVVSIPANSGVVVAYPTPFPNACLSVLAIAGANAVGNPMICGVNAATNNKTEFRAYNSSTTTLTQPGLFMALGF